MSPLPTAPRPRPSSVTSNPAPVMHSPRSGSGNTSATLQRERGSPSEARGEGGNPCAQPFIVSGRRVEKEQSHGESALSQQSPGRLDHAASPPRRKPALHDAVTQTADGRAGMLHTPLRLATRTGGSIASLLRPPCGCRRLGVPLPQQPVPLAPLPTPIRDATSRVAFRHRSPPAPTGTSTV